KSAVAVACCAQPASRGTRILQGPVPAEAVLTPHPGVLARPREAGPEMPHAVARAPARRGHAAARAGQREALDAFLRGVERRALRIAEISCATREEALDRVRAAMLA